jgi:dUTP pyrophosphatase
MQVRIINRSENQLPAYETEASAGMDLRANLEHSIILKPLERLLIPTGLLIELPRGYEAQIRPRSGLALKHGITILNSPGTIDADYRGEVMILLINITNQEFQVNHGDRIAQMIIASHENVQWDEVEILTETLRGTGGYGHTGL